MFEIFKNMMKEEWRIHSTLFSSVKFILFPLLITVISLGATLSYPYLEELLPQLPTSLITHYLFLTLGVTVGAFGLLGKEFMNRRFGQVSLVSYSSRSLPVSERSIFFNFFVKDVIFYLGLWIIPLLTGFGISSILLEISYVTVLKSAVSLPLSFLIGLSSSFILSTIYSRFNRTSIVLFIILGTLLLLSTFPDLLELLPSYSFFQTLKLTHLLTSSLLIIIPSLISFFFLEVDYSQPKRQFSNAFNQLSEFLNPFVSKDFLDLNRSEGGAGKVIFSYLFPLLFIWLTLRVFFNLISVGNYFLVFSTLLGAIGSTMYNWVTEFDLFSSYSFLPINVPDLIKNKIKSYFLLNVISVFILIILSVQTRNVNFLLHGVITFTSVSNYCLSVTIFLTGLHPNLLLYDTSVLFKYLLFLTPVMSLILVGSLFNPYNVLYSLLLLPISYFILKLSFNKWEKFTHLSY